MSMTEVALTLSAI